MTQKALILYMKDENSVNQDFQKNQRLPTLERVIEATQGNVVLSFVPARLPGVEHGKPIQVKLHPEVVDYARMLTEHYKLELGQLGLDHCCEKCYQPGKDRHSHEEFLRHGTNRDKFREDLKARQDTITSAFGKIPRVFTSPQNWMHDEKRQLNVQALQNIFDNFEILALTHPKRVLGVPFYRLTETGTINVEPGFGSENTETKIIPTVDLTDGDKEAIERHAGLYVHYDDLLGQGKKYVKDIESIGRDIIKPNSLSYTKNISLSDLYEDVSRTALIRGLKELVK